MWISTQLTNTEKLSTKYVYVEMIFAPIQYVGITVKPVQRAGIHIPAWVMHMQISSRSWLYAIDVLISHFLRGDWIIRCHRNSICGYIVCISIRNYYIINNIVVGTYIFMQYIIQIFVNEYLLPCRFFLEKMMNILNRIMYGFLYLNSKIYQNFYIWGWMCLCLLYRKKYISCEATSVFTLMLIERLLRRDWIACISYHELKSKRKIFLRLVIYPTNQLFILKLRVEHNIYDRSWICKILLYYHHTVGL